MVDMVDLDLSKNPCAKTCGPRAQSKANAMEVEVEHKFASSAVPEAVFHDSPT